MNENLDISLAHQVNFYYQIFIQIEQYETCVLFGVNKSTNGM